MQCDFVISVHALERFEERFPALWTTDGEVGRLIHRETMEALDAGRSGHVPPLEIANHNITQWTPGKSIFAWTADKARGYVLVEDDRGEMTVATVLLGQPFSQARKKLHDRRSWLRREEKDDPRNDENPSTTGVETPSVPHLDERESATGTDGG